MEKDARKRSAAKRTSAKLGSNPQKLETDVPAIFETKRRPLIFSGEKKRGPLESARKRIINGHQGAVSNQHETGGKGC